MFANDRRRKSHRQQPDYFHHHAAQPRQAKFVSFACHRVGSCTTAFPVGVPRNAAQEATAIIVRGEGTTLGNGTSASFY